MLRTYAEGRRLAIIFPRDPARNDVTIEVQAGGNLIDWDVVATSTLGATFSGTGFVSEIDAGNGLKTVEVRDTVNIGNTTRRFLRLRITH